MKIVRFKAHDTAAYGILETDGKINEICGSVFDKHKLGSKTYNLNEVKLLAPCTPSKIVCVGLNYKAHIDEFVREKSGQPEEPVLFIKPSTAVIGPNDEILYPERSQRVDYEAELAVVIGKVAKNVPEKDIENYIFGYTCGNDVTARDLQRKDGQWTRGKGFDTFAPLGPWIETELDTNNLEIKLLLNGQIKQASNTNKMIFPVQKLVSFISQIMTLLPGDVIMTGTPEGVEPMNVGDTVKVEIEGIGSLQNVLTKLL